MQKSPALHESLLATRARPNERERNSKHLSASADLDTQPKALKKIVDAAMACFEAQGIAKTRIEEIARVAKVSRPTVYRYFPDKNNIVDYISVLQSLSVNEAIHRITKRTTKVEDTLVQALQVAIGLAHENPLARRLLEETNSRSRNADPTSAVHMVQRERWLPLLTRASEAGKLVTGLSLEEVVSWLTLAQGMLLVKVEAVSFTEDELRAFIRRFVVAPILKAPPAAWRLD